jgi:uncharacterized lipoprotein YmbA
VSNLLFVALVLVGCGATGPKEQFYTLSSAPPPEATTPATVTVFIAAVSVPEAVDRTPMVIRTGPNQVEIEDLHRWAEPLKTAIPRVLAANLGRELGTARVASGRYAQGDADYRVTVDVRRFESSLAEGATLEAAWTVAGKTGAPVSGRTLTREPATSGDHAGIAAAHSRALERLARDIAGAISQPRATPPPRVPA